MHKMDKERNYPENGQSEHRLFSAEEFFASQPPPARLQEHLNEVLKFVERNASAGRRVVLVTSGGTTVPLEHNVVRFLDNFSAGTRGSSSAEHFLRTGRYAVIFLHRQHSLQPFSRHYSHSTNPFLDLLEIVDDGTRSTTPADTKGKSTKSPEWEGEEDLKGMLFPPVPVFSSATKPISSLLSSPVAYTAGTSSESDASISQQQQIRIPPPHLKPMLSLLKSYKLVKKMGILHSIAYTTVDEYMFFLRGVSGVMGKAKDHEGNALGRRGMYYLAAAVSDFFIPRQKMSVHKIQSGKGSLIIEMDQVPKVLKAMVDEWSNDGYIVSFKLETDKSLIIPKSKVALERYGHQVVIGNSLVDRKHEVVFVSKSSEEWVRIHEDHRDQIGSGGEIREIEEDIVAKLVGMHSEWIAGTVETSN